MDPMSYYLAEQQIADRTRSTRAAQRHAITPRNAARRRAANRLRRLAEALDREALDREA